MFARQYTVRSENAYDQVPHDVEELVFQLPDAQELPAAVDWSALTSLQHLDLSQCSNLQQLPAAICSIPSLRSLIVGGQSDHAPACAQLSALPTSISNLTALTHLNLYGCRSLAALPDSIGSLQALKEINLSNCTALQQLPKSLCDLGALQQLSLHNSTIQQLPSCLGRLSALQLMDLLGSLALTQLPESLGALGRLRVLDLRGCCCLQELPSSLGCCSSLEALQLSGCAALTALPHSIGSCRQLQQLSLRGCCRLKLLPRSCSRLTALQQFDFEGCPACAGISTRSQAVDQQHGAQTPSTVSTAQGSVGEVPVAGQGSAVVTVAPLKAVRVSARLPTSPTQGSVEEVPGQGSAVVTVAPADCSCCSNMWGRWFSKQQQQQQQQQQQPGVAAGAQLVRSALMLQRHRSAVVKLATQQEPMLSTLERMSWLVVLLATATFVAFTMPPGGYGDNQQVLTSHTAACGSGTHLGVDADGLSTPAFQQCAMLLFFVFDGLSFGLSLGCVMMIVVLSMPRIPWECEEAEAGRFYLLLSVTWSLLYTAVATGFASFIAAGLSVNRQVKVVIGPVVPGMFLLVVGGVLLCYRFWCLAPGWDAVLASLSFHNQEVKDVCEVERGQELFWRYWGDKLSKGRPGSSTAATSGSAAAADDVELQRLLPS